MPDLISEQLSALFDAELPLNEVPLSLQRLEKEEELKTTWCRYQLIHDVIQQNEMICHYPGLAQKIDLMLESEEQNESSIVSPSSFQKNDPVRSKSRSHTVWGIGIAAVVALFFVVLMIPQMSRDKTSPSEALISQNGVTEATSFDEWQELPPEIQSRLLGYIMSYDNYTSSERMPGVTPGFVRAVAYEQ